MTLEILVKYVHYLCIFAIVGSLVSEHLLLKDKMSRDELKRIARIDGVYGIAAILLLAAGLTLWFGVGKPAEIYSKNWIFHFKVTLFVVLGLLSIYPTIFFLKHQKGDDRNTLVEVPSQIKWLLRMELLILFSMPLLATLMARGIGYFG